MIGKKLGKYLLVAACIFTGIAIGTPAVQAASLNMHYSDYWYNREKQMEVIIILGIILYMK